MIDIEEVGVRANSYSLFSVRHYVVYVFLTEEKLVPRIVKVDGYSNQWLLQPLASR